MKIEHSIGIDSISMLTYDKINMYSTIENLLNYKDTRDTFGFTIGKEAIDETFTIIPFNKHENNSTFVYKKDNHIVFRYSTGITPQGKIFHIISFDGLKTYNEQLDKLRNDTLSRVLKAIVINNRQYINWELRQLDVYIDFNVEQNKIIVTRDRKRGLSLNPLPLRTDSYYYLEKVAINSKGNVDKINQAIKGKIDKKNQAISSYLYNKTLKEKKKHHYDIGIQLSRFEISILRKGFKKIKSVDDICKLINEYTIYIYDETASCIKDKKQYNNNKKNTPSSNNIVKIDNSVIIDFLKQIMMW